MSSRDKGNTRLSHPAYVVTPKRMKTSPDDVLKSFKGLAIAAARARELAEAGGKEGLVRGMVRRQEDTLRQHLIDASKDVDAIVKVFQNRLPKSLP